MRDGPAKCHEYHFTAGHVFYPIMKDLLHPETKWMTMLREPVERTYSHYNHLIRYKLTDIETFEEFVHRSQDRQMGRNLMARHLAWWPKHFTGIPSYSGEIERIPLDIPEDELEHRAMEVLRNFWHIGIQETGWIQAVQAIYGEWGKTPSDAGLEQKAPRNWRSKMSDQIIADVEGFNQVDIRIYEHYKEK
jgi:hypothetical protein